MMTLDWARVTRARVSLSCFCSMHHAPRWPRHGTGDPFSLRHETAEAPVPGECDASTTRPSVRLQAQDPWLPNTPRPTHRAWGFAICTTYASVRIVCLSFGLDPDRFCVASAPPVISEKAGPKWWSEAKRLGRRQVARGGFPPPEPCETLSTSSTRPSTPCCSQRARAQANGTALRRLVPSLGASPSTDRTSDVSHAVMRASSGAGRAPRRLPTGGVT